MESQQPDLNKATSYNLMRDILAIYVYSNDLVRLHKIETLIQSANATDLIELISLKLLKQMCQFQNTGNWRPESWGGFLFGSSVSFEIDLLHASAISTNGNQRPSSSSKRCFKHS